MKKNKQSPDMLKSAECRYAVNVLHIKSLSPYVKDNVFNFLHLIYVIWVWMCNVVKREMVGEFILNFIRNY